MLALADFCLQHSHVIVRYAVPSMVCSYYGGETITQGLFLSLVVRGEDLRSVASVKGGDIRPE